MSLPKYSEYKESGAEWLGALPMHWQVNSLKRCARLLTEKATTKIRPVALENIESWSGRFIESEGEFEGDGVAFEAGDILFGKLRPYLAKVYLANSAGEAVGDFHVIRTKDGLHSRYAQYQMLQREFIGVVDGSTFGSKMPRASWNFIGGLPFAVPSAHEQEAIANFLDRETAKIDTLITEQEELLALLAEKRQATISHAVTRGVNSNAAMKDSGVVWLGDVPAHWNVVRLGSIYREAAEDGSDELPILSVSIHDGVSDRELIDVELDRKVTRSEDRSKYKRVVPNDLTYNMMRAWQGGFGTVTVVGQVSPAYVVARPRCELRTTFVEQLLRTPQAIEQIRRYSRGITDFRLRLYWQEFKNIRIALPQLKEQGDVLMAIASETDKYDRLEHEAERAIGLLKERRSALIAAAVTGKIDVREVAKRRVGVTF